MKHLLVSAALLFSACSESEELLECGSDEDRVHLVVTSLGYMRSEDGTSMGYDLDGTEYAVCGVKDLESPEGEPGSTTDSRTLYPP